MTELHYIIVENFTNFTYYNVSSIVLDDDSICQPFYVYLRILHTYYIPIVIIVGLIGNFLSFIVFSTTHLKMRSSSYYLSALALADLFFIVTVFVVFLSFNEIFEIFNKDGWCQLFVYLSSSCSSVSVWLIVAFTVERFIAIQYPLQRPLICTVSRARIIVTTLVLLAFTSQLYVFWIAGLITVQDKKECEMLPDYQEFMRVVNFIDTFVTLIIPFVLIVAMNSLIARNLLLFRKRLQLGMVEEINANKDETELRHSNTQTGSLAIFEESRRSTIRTTQQSIKRSTHKDQKKCSQYNGTLSRSTTSAKGQQNITKMLLLISSVFIALNFPSYVIRLWVYFAFTLQDKDPPEALWCAQQFAMLLYYTNFCINFLLYAMCGITFRRCLWQLIRNTLKKVSRRP